MFTIFTNVVEGMGTYFSKVFDATTIFTISLLTIALLITSFENKGCKEWKYIVHTVGVYIVFFCATALLQSVVFSIMQTLLKGINNPLELANVIIIVVYSLLFIVRKEKNKVSPLTKIFVLVSTAMIVSCMSNHLGRGIGLLTETMENNTPIVVLFRFFPYTFLVIVAVLFRAYDVSKYSKLSWVFGVVTIALSVSLFAISMFDKYGGNEDISLHFYLFIIYFLVLGSEIIAYIAMCQTQKNLRSSVRDQAEATIYSSEAKMMEISKGELEILRELRHELKNQYSYMSILIKEKNYEELEKFFGEMNQNFLDNVGIVDCGNQLVSSIINMELAKAKANNITLEHVEVVPPILPYDKVSLSSLISNIIDNAIEAVVREESEDRTIQFSIITYQEYLRICCKNKTKSTEVKHKTSKKEAGHGYGLRVIKKIADKYNGTADFVIEDGVFIVDTILQLTHKEEEKKNA